MKKTKIFFGFLILFLLFSLQVVAQEDEPRIRAGRLGVNVEGLGGSFYLGANIELGLTNQFVIGAGVGIDILIILMGVDYHVYAKYYLFGTPLDIYFVGEATFFEGKVLAIFEYQDTNITFGSARIGIEWQTPLLFYFAIDAGVLGMLETAHTQFIPWGGACIGIRL